MRTIESLKAESNSIIDSYKKGEKVSRKHKNILELNNKCVFALEFKLKEEQAVNQLNREIERLEKVTAGFEEWKKNTPGVFDIKDPKAYYERIMGVKLMTDHIKFLRYILEQ